MQGCETKALLGLVGFTSTDLRSVEQAADRLGWPTRVYESSDDPALLLLAEAPTVLFINIDGIDPFAPAFVASVREGNDEIAIVCVSDVIFPGIADQLRRGGADLIGRKHAVLKSIEHWFQQQEACQPTDFLDVTVVAEGWARREEAALKSKIIDQLERIAS